MLYCVDEVAYVLQVERAWVYYHLRMYNISSLKIGDSWRITEQGLDDAVRLFVSKRAGEVASDNGLEGYSERLASVRQTYAANSARSPFTCVSRPRRRLASSTQRLYPMVRRQARQLELWEDDNFW
jgi:hypothetical protein